MLGSPSRHQMLARLALLMLDSGMIPPKRWTRSVRNLEAICTKSFVAWVEQRLGTLRVLNPSFWATVREPSEGAAESGLWIGWCCDDTSFLTIGPAIRAFADLHPRLPATVLAAINKAGWNSIPVFCFDDQLSVCECYMWGGEEDATQYADGLGMKGEAKEGYLSSVIKRADILERTPEEVFTYWKKQFKSARRLTQIGRGQADFMLRRIIELTTVLRRMDDIELVRNFHREAAESGEDFVGHGVVLRWSSEDFTPDVFQAVGQSAYDSGCGHDECCVHEQALDDYDSFKSFVTGLSSAIDTMRALDELLWLLSAEEWSSYSPNREQAA